MLSQFSQTCKTAGTAVDEYESIDDEDEGIGCHDEEMDELLDDADIDDDEEQLEDDLNVDQEASDKLEIEELARAVEKAHKLSRAQLNHGRFAVTKVRHYLLIIFLN